MLGERHDQGVLGQRHDQAEGVLVVTDMHMAGDHLEYVEQQLGLGSVSVLETDPPWSRELKWQLRANIPTSGAVLFNFSTMNTRSYSFEIIEEFILFAKNLAISNQVKVIVSTLPPRYMGWWDNRQYSEHHEVNSSMLDFMAKHMVGSAGVIMAGQSRLNCPVGRVREARFTEWGALSHQGTFLYLKNILSSTRPSTTRGRKGWWGGTGRSEAGGKREDWSGGISEKKLFRILQKILKQNE